MRWTLKTSSLRTSDVKAKGKSLSELKEDRDDDYTPHDLDGIDIDDPKAFEAFAAGRRVAIFPDGKVFTAPDGVSAYENPNAASRIDSFTKDGLLDRKNEFTKVAVRGRSESPPEWDSWNLSFGKEEVADQGKEAAKRALWEALKEMRKSPFGGNRMVVAGGVHMGTGNLHLGVDVHRIGVDLAARQVTKAVDMSRASEQEELLTRGVDVMQSAGFNLDFKDDKGSVFQPKAGRAAAPEPEGETLGEESALADAEDYEAGPQPQRQPQRPSVSPDRIGGPEIGMARVRTTEPEEEIIFRLEKEAERRHRDAVRMQEEADAIRVAADHAAAAIAKRKEAEAAAAEATARAEQSEAIAKAAEAAKVSAEQRAEVAEGARVEAEGKLTEATAQIASLDERVADLTQQVAETRDQVRDLTTERDELKTELEASEQNAASIAADLDREKTERAAEVQALTGQVEQAKAETSAAKAETEQAKAETTAVRGELDAAKAEAAKLREQLAAAGIENGTLKAENKTLSERVKELTDQLERQARDFASEIRKAISEAVQETENRVTQRFDSIVTGLNGQIATLQGQVNEARQQLADFIAPKKADDKKADDSKADDKKADDSKADAAPAVPTNWRDYKGEPNKMSKEMLAAFNADYTKATKAGLVDEGGGSKGEVSKARLAFLQQQQEVYQREKEKAAKKAEGPSDGDEPTKKPKPKM